LTKIILITSISDLNLIPNDLLKSNDTKIFSFNLDVHLELKNQKINHTIADDLLSLDERLRIFDKMAEFRSWHSKISSSDFELKGVNLLKILDRNEFQTYLLPILINLVIVKEIIKKEKPTKIIATNQISKIIQSIIKNNHIETEFFKNEIEKNLLWDNITVKYNIGGIPLTFTLSRQKYLKIKNIFENLSGLFYNFWFKFDQSKKKSIVFLEFNPQLFSRLFEEMANYDGDVILINHRRSAIWNKKSIEVIKKSKCKILKLDDVLNKHEQAQIPLLVDNYSRKIDNLWKNSEILSNIFQIDGYNFWDSIKDVMMKIYSERLFSYMVKQKKLFLK